MEKNSKNHATDLTKPLNRRQLLRYAAAASAAAAITGRAKARAEIPVRYLTLGKQDPSDPDTYAIMRCKRAITLLRQNSPTDANAPGMTIGTWLYAPLVDNLTWFIANAKNYHNAAPIPGNPHMLDMDGLENNLTALRDAIMDSSTPQEVREYNLRKYFELHVTADANGDLAYPSPVPAPVSLHFRNVSAVCASPHFTMHNTRRTAAVALLDDRYFREFLSPVQANDMYQVDRVTHLNYDADTTRYSLARMGFDWGIFTEKGTGAFIEDNNRCWSDLTGCRTETDYYCETDSNGQPTTSSDLCP